MMAEVMPEQIAIGRNAALTPCRLGRPKADIRRAAGGVDAQFLTQATHQGEHLFTRRRQRTDWHYQRINHDIMRRNAEIGGAQHDLARHFEPHIGVLRDASVVVGNGHHRHVVFLDQRQHQFQTLFFAGDRVQQGPPLGRRQTGFQRAGHRRIDAQRHIDQPLNEPDHLGHQWRFGLVRVGVRVVNHARIHIEHHRPASDLLQRVASTVNGREIARPPTARPGPCAPPPQPPPPPPSAASPRA